MSLVIHCGAEHVQREELDRVQLPPVKRNSKGHITFQPISHETVLNKIMESLVGHLGSGAIRDSAQAMTADGQRAFGLIELQPDRQRRGMGDKTGLIVGWRNAHDFKFASAVAMGARTFVCDNLSFCGEVRVARRHTRFIVRDFPGVVASSIGRLLQARHGQQRLFDKMEEFKLGRHYVNDTLIESMRAGAIPNASIPKVLGEYESDHHREMHGSGNAWSLFNAFTEVSKKDSLPVAMKRTQKLHGVFSKLVGVAT